MRAKDGQMTSALWSAATCRRFPFDGGAIAATSRRTPKELWLFNFTAVSLWSGCQEARAILRRRGCRWVWPTQIAPFTIQRPIHPTRDSVYGTRERDDV